MLNKRFTWLALILWFFSAAAAAECSSPELVSVPDGSTATNEEMVNGQTAVKSWIAEMETYIDCLDKEAAKRGEEQTADEKQAHIAKHNAAVDSMNEVAAQFNSQVQAYKAANP